MTEKEQIQFLTEQNNQLRDMIRLKDEFFEREHQQNLEDKKKLACLKDLEEQQDEFIYDLAMLYFIITRCEIELINGSKYGRCFWGCYAGVKEPEFLQADEPFYTNIDNPNHISLYVKQFFNFDYILQKIKEKGLKHIIENRIMEIEKAFGLQHYGNRVDVFNKYLQDKKRQEMIEEEQRRVEEKYKQKKGK